MSTSAHLILTAEDKTHAAFRSLNQNIHGALESLGGLKNKLLAVAGVAAFWHLVEPAIEAGAEIEKLSKMLGASTESLSQFKYVAELAHVPLISLTQGWRLMEKNVALAAAGTGTAKNALRDLGISAVELKKLKPETQFEILADAMARVENPASKVRFAMQIFGRAGADLIPIMEGGSKAIQAAREEADKLGLTLDETSTHQFAKAHEAIVRLKSAFAGTKNTLAIAFAPLLGAIADGLGFILPKAANVTARAFIFLDETASLALASLTRALRKLLSLLGKWPGTVGKFFRESAQATEQFTHTMSEHVTHCEKRLASLTQGQKAYHESVKKTGQTLTTAYQSVLQAIHAHHRDVASGLQKLTASQKRYQRLLEKGKQLTEELRTPQEIYRDHLKEINHLLQAGAINHQTYSRAILHYQKALQEANGITKHLIDQKKQAEEHIKTLANLFRDGLFAYLESGFKGMVKSFENALSAMAADAAASEISHFLFGTLGNSALKSSGGLLGQLFNNGLGQLFGFNRFGGFRAEGGAVFPGRSYIVGERGAEIFIPNQSGRIISHDQLRQNQNVPSIVMHIHTPDAHSFRLSRNQITAEMGFALQRALHRST